MNEVDIITRPGFWEIPGWAIFLVYFGGLIAVGFVVAGIIKSRQLWQAGQPTNAPSEPKKRWSFLLQEALFQKRIKDGILGSRRHFWISWGFVVLFLGTALAVLDWDIGKLIFDKQFLSGKTFYLYKLILDVAGILCLGGLAFAFYRRFVCREERLEASTRFLAITGSLALIIVTGYLVEALRLAAEKPDYAVWSPVGNLIASVFYSDVSREFLVTQHLWMWLFHMTISLIFVGYIPYSYYSHIYKAPTSIYWQKTNPKGELPKIEDIEEQENFGISKFTQFTAKDRLNFDACTECGRCTSVCPVNRAKGPLDPRAIVLSLKKRMNDNYDKLDEPLVPELISQEALLSCTTCGACIEQCPSRIDIVGIINQMRRSISLEQGEFAPGVANVLQNIQSVGNPWGLDPDSRWDWAKDLDLPFAEPGRHYDILYWVGCSGSFDRRSQKIARAMVKILKESHLSFAVMREEMCNAEFARRVGEEYTYQVQCEQNIANLRQYNFSRILCHCPHCFNTIKNEYPQFENGLFNVISHVQFIADQFSSGRFRAQSEELRRLVMHDPCYLSRYNNIVGESRNVLNSIKGLETIDPAECGTKTTCCGAGGGQFWTDGTSHERLNVIRLKALVTDKKSQEICTSCPYCLSMLEAACGTDPAFKDVKVEDIAEIVAKLIK